jgi:hypothetical protein
VVGAEEVVSWRLGIDGAVDVFYNTVVVDGDLEWRWIGVSMIRECAKKFLNPCKPARRAAASGRFEYGSKYLAVVIVEYEDFERALMDIEPIFGAKSQQLKAYYCNGFVPYYYGDSFDYLMGTMEQRCLLVEQEGTYAPAYGLH